MKFSTVSGALYMLMLEDDFSRFKWVFMLKQKFQETQRILDFIQEQEAKWGRKVRGVQTDRGREFLNKELGARLWSLGIDHNLTAPYTP
jgi:transposase InsO family protein